jgi:hypothetical protein
MRQELATAQKVSVGREVFSRLREDAFPLDPGELYGGRADDAPGDIVLHGKNVFELGIVGVRKSRSA